MTELPFPDRGEFIVTHFESPAEFYLQNEDCIVGAVELQSKVDAQVAASKSYAESGQKAVAGVLIGS